MVAVTEGLFDDVPLDRVEKIKNIIQERSRGERTDISRRIEEGEELGQDEKDSLIEMAKNVIGSEGM